MATSTRPRRQARPKVSVTTTGTSTPVRWRRAERRPRPSWSGSAGRSTAVPGAALERSTPALAQMNPWRVRAMIRSPRRRRISTACSWARRR